MRVAVTGASGFIGGHLVDRLLKGGMTVRVLYHRTAVPVREGLTAVPGGLDDAAAVARLVEGADAVVHCAGLVAARSAEDFRHINAEGTRRLARAAAEAGVTRFLLISSLAARQPQLSAYAASKQAAESAVAEILGDRWDALRPPAVYGPGDRQVLTFLRLIKHGIALLPAGETARVSLIHVEDLVEAIWEWLRGPMPSAAVYELADDQNGGYSWRALIEAAARALTVEPRYVAPSAGLLRLVGHGMRAWGRLNGRTPFLTPDKVRELCHADWVCRDDRFRRLTGWQPRVPLGDGMRQTVAWYRAHDWL